MAKSYEQIYQDALKANKVETRAYEFIRWVGEGECIVGILEDIEEHDSSTFDGTFKVFKFKTDDGRKSCILGAGGTRMLSDNDLGKIVSVVYKGEVKLPSGRTMRDFEVSVITDNINHPII